MTTDRCRRRVRELREASQLVKDLARVPDRATEKDFRQVADLMADAATDLEELIQASPPGCLCRRVQTDNYAYLDYAEGCLHHRQLFVLCEKLKADYEKAERALKNEVRLKLVVAALTGAAARPAQDCESLVEQADALAEAAIRRITSP